MLRLVLGLALALLCAASTSATAADESEECLTARRAASFADTTCRLATGQCYDSCASARTQAETVCDRALARARAWCQENDPSMIPQCMTPEHTRHNTCLASARAISTCSTDECSNQTSSCANARLKQAQAAVTCGK